MATPALLEGGQLEQRPPVIATQIDFSQTPLDCYTPYFALILDNVFTPSECDDLRAFAGDDWETLAKGDSFRECDRILKFDRGWADQLYHRIAPHLPAEITELRRDGQWSEHVAGKANLKATQGAKKSVWRLKEVNERFSFLRYRPGQQFKPHCDQLFHREGGGEKSFLTVQVYLKEGPGEGGETRFWNPQREVDKVVDVKPKLGRAIVFQQRMLWHSGEAVREGEKYAVRTDLMYERTFS